MWQSFRAIGRGSSEIRRWKKNITGKIENLPLLRTGGLIKQRDTFIVYSFKKSWQTELIQLMQ